MKASYPEVLYYFITHWRYKLQTFVIISIKKPLNIYTNVWTCLVSSILHLFFILLSIFLCFTFFSLFSTPLSILIFFLSSFHSILFSNDWVNDWTSNCIWKSNLMFFGITFFTISNCIFTYSTASQEPAGKEWLFNAPTPQVLYFLTSIRVLRTQNAGRNIHFRHFLC